MSWIEDLIGEKPKPVCEKGEFIFAAIGLEHGHINGMCNGLIQAGAELKWVYDKDPVKIENFRKKFPNVRVSHSEEEILEDPTVHLIAAATVPSDRYRLGLETMDHGKDYFTAKAPFTSLDQLAEVRRKIRETKLKYAIFFSERLKEDSAIFAGRLINDGEIGRAHV